MKLTDEQIDIYGDIMEHAGFSDDKIDQYFLEHYGTKGMQWGVRKERRKRNRELNRKSREKDAKKYRKEIDDARARLDSGQHTRTFRESRAQFRSDRDRFGSRVARQRRAERTEAFNRDFEAASQIRDGREAAVAILAGVGTVAVSALLSSRANA